MSRVGKQPVSLPSGVNVDVKDRCVTVSGPKGTLTWTHASGVTVATETGQVLVRRASDATSHRALHGTTRALVQNMVLGVSQGYEIKMEIYGTGYQCAVSGKTLDLVVGYSHPVKLPIPDGVQVEVEVPTARGNETPAKLTIRGIDKQVVGQFARDVKDVRKPEPYKGKGIRYAGEQIRRKAGKAFAGAGGG